MRFVPLLLALLLAAPAWAQTTLYQQSFEDDDPAFATSATCNDGDTDFFTRTDGSDISSAYEVTGKDGDFFFGAQDIDAEDGDPPENGTCDTTPQRISFDDIDISGFSSLSFAGLFAEDDDGDNQDWDEPDFVHIKYRIDSDDDDDLVNLLFFENDGTTFNTAPLEDTDFDGTGDGTELTSTFAEFTKAIAGTGSTLDIVILFSLDSGDEDIAVDNIRITGTPVVATEPDIRAPGAVQFDVVQLGMSRDRTVTVENLGDADLVVSSATITMSDGGAFTGGSGGFTVAPGDSEDFTVTFTPNDGVRGYTGELTILSNDPDEGEINVVLGGTSTEAPQPEIDVDPLSVDFGDVEAGMTAQRMVTISNTGDATLTLDVDVFGTRFSLVGTAPTSVAPGGSETLTVEFAPVAPGASSGTIRILSDDQDEGSIEVPLTGNGVAAPTPEPEIDVDPTSLAFGTVEVGMSSQMMVTISNDGDATLNLSSVVVSGTGFSLASTAPTSVAPGGSEDVTVEFAPAAAGAASGSLTIMSDDADEGTVTVPLSGTGQDPVEPTDCDYTFEAIATSSLAIGSAGGQATFAFAIDNSGNASAATVDIWAMVMDSDGNTVLVRSPRTPTVPAGATYSAGYNQRIPAGAADGTYTYTIKAGTFADDPADGEVCDSETFTITKGDTAPTAAKTSALIANDWAGVEIVSEEITDAALAVTGDEIRVGPNPTRGATAFAFALAQDGDVRLALYDVQGREVATVVDGPMRAGSHTVSLAQGLPAGVYVWQLRAGDRMETGRLTVVR